MADQVRILSDWAGVMPSLMSLVKHGNADAHLYASGELMRLARGVDAANEGKPGWSPSLVVPPTEPDLAFIGHPGPEYLGDPILVDLEDGGPSPEDLGESPERRLAREAAAGRKEKRAEKRAGEDVSNRGGGRVRPEDLLQEDRRQLEDGEIEEDPEIGDARRREDWCPHGN